MKSFALSVLLLSTILGFSCKPPSDSDTSADGMLIPSVHSGANEEIVNPKALHERSIEDLGELIDASWKEEMAKSVTPFPSLPPDAKRMRIHWNLKLPSLHPQQGHKVIRSEEALAALLAPHCSDHRLELYLEWNNVDFERQMAILSSRMYSTRVNEGYTIESIWETDSEVIVVVRYILPTSLIGPGIMGSITSAVAVNRRDVPVRFEIYTTNHPDTQEVVGSTR